MKRKKLLLFLILEKCEEKGNMKNVPHEDGWVIEHWDSENKKKNIYFKFLKKCGLNI